MHQDRGLRDDGAEWALVGEQPLASSTLDHIGDRGEFEHGAIFWLLNHIIDAARVAHPHHHSYRSGDSV